MRPKSLVLLMLALGCGLVAALGINQVMSNRGHATTVESIATTPIFAALEPIRIGDPIRPEAVKLIEWPSATLPEGVVTELANIEGRFARSTFYPNDPIVEPKLLARGETGAGIGTQIPKGMRIVPVRVDATSGLSGLVKPGDRVDLSVTVRENHAAGISEPATQTFLQNVKVVAVDSEWERNASGTQAVVAKTISLLVKPDQVEMVTMASQIGSIQLSMRSNEDEEIVATTGYRPGEILGLNNSSVDRKNREPSATFAERFPQMGAEPEAANPLLSMLNSLHQGNTAEPAVAAPPANEFTITVWDGETPRQVLLRDGKPVDWGVQGAALGSGAPAVQQNNTSGSPASGSGATSGQSGSTQQPGSAADDGPATPLPPLPDGSAEQPPK